MEQTPSSESDGCSAGKEILNPPCMEPETSLVHSQEPATGHYPEPAESSLQP